MFSLDNAVFIFSSDNNCFLLFLRKPKFLISAHITAFLNSYPKTVLFNFSEDNNLFLPAFYLSLDSGFLFIYTIKQLYSYISSDNHCLSINRSFHFSPDYGCFFISPQTTTRFEINLFFLRTDRIFKLKICASIKDSPIYDTKSDSWKEGSNFLCRI